MFKLTLLILYYSKKVTELVFLHFFEVAYTCTWVKDNREKKINLRWIAKKMVSCLLGTSRVGQRVPD